jgi:hypothetical protein
MPVGAEGVGVDGKQGEVEEREDGAAMADRRRLGEGVKKQNGGDSKPTGGEAMEAMCGETSTQGGESE